MTTLPLTDEDRALIRAATDVLTQNQRPGRHHVGAAVRTRSGKVYTGLHLNSRTIDVCAEWVALGAAAVAGERELSTIVAVASKDGAPPRVVSPCGVCRDLLLYNSPDVEVIFVEEGEVRKALVRDLVPGPYLG